MNVEGLSNEELRILLIQQGQQCGPVVSSTRKLYENKLKRLMKDGEIPKFQMNNQSTPISTGERYKAINSSGGSHGTTNRSEYYGDSSDQYDDDRMEGEESFRYIGPASDTPSSPYSAMGGSMIATPPAPPRNIRTGVASDYNPPSYTFTTDRVSPMKTSNISYHNEPYRRSIAPSVVAPRLAAPTTIPYGSSTSVTKQFSSFNWDRAMDNTKRLAPVFVKILCVVIVIIFILMLVNRAVDSGSGEHNLPA